MTPEGSEVYNTLLATDVPGVDAMCTDVGPNGQADSHATKLTHWSTVSISNHGATCNDDDWGTKAAIPPVSSITDEASSRCTCADVLEAFRTVVVSLMVWLAAWAMMKTAQGSPPFDLEPPLIASLFFFSLIAYGYELRGRRILWAVALPSGGGSTEAFAEKVQALRDASPVVELMPPGGAPVNYRIAEWRDETQRVDPNGYAGAPRGLFFITFPIEIFPGDPSEASALEFTRAEVARAAAGEDASPLEKKVADEAGSICEDAEKVAVHSRLRWSDGSEGLPLHSVLADGSEAACLRPWLFIAVFSLFGLVADALLRATLAPLPWPVRKRIFTIQGNDLGKIRFCITSSGEVRLDGDEEDLRDANKFWIKEQDWRALWADARLVAPQAARLRRLRVATCCGAGLTAAATALAVVLQATNAKQEFIAQAIGAGLALTLGFFAAAGLAGCLAHRAAQQCVQSFARQLRGTAACNAAWLQAGPDMLVISVEQLVSERSAKASQMPIGSYAPSEPSKTLDKLSPCK